VHALASLEVHAVASLEVHAVASLEVHAKFREERCREIIEPKLENAQCSFRSVRGTTDQIFTPQKN